MDTWVEGVDVSVYQGIMDFAITKSRGVRWVAIRSGNGMVKDKKFEENYDKARSANIDLVTVYHVFQPLISPLEQGDFWYELIKDRPIDLPPFEDVELSASISQSTYVYRVRAMGQRLKDKLKKNVGIYTRGTFWNYYIGKAALAWSWSSWPLFVARYNSAIIHPWIDDPAKYKPIGFNDYRIWQWSADGNNMGKYYGASSRDIDLDRVKKGWYNWWYAKKKINTVFLPITMKLGNR